jgi:heat shock protein HslJ
MSRRLLLTVLAVGIATLVLPGCGAKNQMAELTANPWAVTQILTQDGHVSVLPDSVPAVYFRSDGTAIGNLTVNAFRGPYKVEARNLSIGPLVTTQWVGPQMSMAQEQIVHDALTSTARYVIKNGVLQLSDAGGELLMSLKVAEDPKLVGPTWMCTAYASGKGDLVSIVGTSPIVAAFAPDGTLTGSGGVNSYSSTYKVAGSQMTIGPEITSTKMTGSEQLMAQEARYLDALAKTASYKIESYQLTLADQSGAALATYVPLAPK